MERDQHFMIDEALITKIVDALEIKDNESVLEIGAGKGALTRELVKKSKKITAIEIDRALCKVLKKEFPCAKVLSQNAVDWKRYKADKIIGNLPYSICEPVMNKLLRSEFKAAVLTVPVSFLNGGVLGLLMPLFLNIELIEIVGKRAFSPRPKIKSKVIRITHKPLDKKEGFLLGIYLCNKGILRNALRESYCKVYGLTKNQAKEKMPELNFLDKRVYMLGFDEWKELIEKI